MICCFILINFYFQSSKVVRGGVQMPKQKGQQNLRREGD
jgi:hypothetical protein